MTVDGPSDMEHDNPEPVASADKMSMTAPWYTDITILSFLALCAYCETLVGGECMSHVVELTDEQYETLRQVAARDQESPEQLIARMVSALAETQGPIYFTDDEFLRALGADDQELAELAQLETADDANE
jgi:hypothetical protein